MKNPWYFTAHSAIGKKIDKKESFKLSQYHWPRGAIHNFSVLRMNSNFLEFINRDYLWKGKSLVSTLIFALPLLILSIWYAPIFLEDSDYFIYSLYVFFFISIVYIFLTMATQFFKSEFLKPLYNPIIFLKSGQFFFQKSDKELITANIEDVYFHILETYGVAGSKIYELHLYIVDDKSIIIEDIQIGAPNYVDETVKGLLQFIKIYYEDGPNTLVFKPEEDFVEHNSVNKLTYCYDIIDKKESIQQSWETIFYPYFFAIVIQVLFTIPEILRLFGRRITLIFSKKTQYHPELKKYLEIELDDPYNVTAKDNFKFGLLEMKGKKGCK